MKQILLVLFTVYLYLSIFSTCQADTAFRPNAFQRLQIEMALADFNLIMYLAEKPLIILRYGEGQYSLQWNESMEHIASHFHTEVQLVVTDPLWNEIIRFDNITNVMNFLNRSTASPRPQPMTVPRIISSSPSHPSTIADFMGDILGGNHHDNRERCTANHIVVLAYDFVPISHWFTDLDAMKVVSSQNQQITLARKCVSTILDNSYRLQSMIFNNIPIV